MNEILKVDGEFKGSALFFPSDLIIISNMYCSMKENIHLSLKSIF